MLLLGYRSYDQNFTVLMFFGSVLLNCVIAVKMSRKITPYLAA